MNRADRVHIGSIYCSSNNYHILHLVVDSRALSISSRSQQKMTPSLIRPVGIIISRTLGSNAHFQKAINIQSTRLLASTSIQSIDQDAESARSRFRNTDTNPSVLKYIERIGVGKPTRTKRRRGSKNNNTRHLSLSEEEEKLGRGRRCQTVPPPPFAPSNRSAATGSGQSVRQLPVKLLARVGCANSFPKPSPNLPEVVGVCCLD